MATGMLRPAGLRAADFPQRPITIVVPFPPGGSTDLLARRIGEKLSSSLDASVIVQNRGGAGGIIGSNYVAHARPDGYTLLFGVTGTNAISASLYTVLPFDPRRDFTPVSVIVSAPLILVVNAHEPIKNLADYVDISRKNPNAMTFGSPGNGTSMHLTGEMFAQAAGLRLMHVPFHGSAPAMQALLSGQIRSLFGDIAVMAPQIRAGTLCALAVTSRVRQPEYPDVPTIAESGFPGFESLSWQGIFAPASTPAPVIDVLNQQIVAAAKAPDLSRFFALRGMTVEGRSVADSTAFVNAEITKWTAVVKKTGIHIG
jgi:tripartite-type tricarboxylate transporter receptor subunit TctC